MSIHSGRNRKQTSQPVCFSTGRALGVIAVLLLGIGRTGTADQPAGDSPPIVSSQKYPGYQSLWYSHTPDWKGEVIPGRSYEYGPKQGGGLGTYQAVHIPRTIYAPEVQKTFFAYGGTKQDQRHLLAMVSYFDHRTGLVPQPTIVHDKQGVDDAHDNPVITLDEHGHVWVFVAGRGRHRPGFLYRSIQPYSTDAFERFFEGEFAYPQPWWIEGQKLAGMRGHYQVSNARGNRVFTAFSWHPGGNVDRRTNLYYLETRDMGRTWQTAAGRPVDAADGFYAMWADGNWYTYTRSYLYFTNRQGDRVWRLPYTMDQDHASPEVMECWSDP